VRTYGTGVVEFMTDVKFNRQRATRVQLAIPVVITGSNQLGMPFKEITQTLAVNSNGCLVELVAPVIKEQALVLINSKTNKEMACNVVTLGNNVKGKTQVGLRFAEPSPRFWGLAFPPEDWDPSTRKLPDPVSR
jgi:hypothetical protein